jgi:CelD/BcsL family acetyltransferase involved in cellulose biosynthesis
MTAAPTTTETTYNLRVYSQDDDWGTLAELWRNLETRDSSAKIFQTFTWVSHVWRLDRGPDAELSLVVVHQSDGRLAAVAPMMTARAMGVVGVRVLQFIGSGPSDYLDILMADDCNTHKVIGLLADWFDEARTRHDVILLDHLADCAHVIEHRERLLPDSSADTADLEHIDTTRYFPVPDEFEQYLLSISKNRRRHFRQHWRKLNQDFQVDIHVPRSGGDAEGDLAEMMRMHQARQNIRGQRGMFRDQERVDLFTSLFKTLIDESRAQLWTMTLDGQASTSEVFLRFNGTVIDYNGGWEDNPAVRLHGMSNLMLFKQIERACDDTSVTEIELGIGDESYKASFAKQSRPIHRIIIRRRGLRAWLFDLHERSLAFAYHNPHIQRLYFALRGKSTRPTK